MDEKPRILILAPHFLPGEKSGGPPRSIAALTHHLARVAEFLVVSSDRDYGDTAPYPDIGRGEWLQVGNATCRYLGPDERSPARIARLLRETDHDLLYLNTMFSGPFSLYPLLLRKVRATPQRPVLLAPRGQLEPGALAIKSRKKHAYLRALRASGALSDVTWHSTGPAETESIRRWFGEDAAVREAANLRVAPPKPHMEAREGPLTIAFLSRISPKKNLRGALVILEGVRSEVVFDIYGPGEDRAYLTACKELSRKLPENIKTRFLGPLDHRDVHATLARYDLFLLPSQSENYGHVIAEALAAGCPPLISDQTPWRQLAQRGIGWDLPLHDLDGFRRVIEDCAAEDPSQSLDRKSTAAAYMAERDSNPEERRRNAQLFGLAVD